jgi:hypothetical protein
VTEEAHIGFLGFGHFSRRVECVDAGQPTGNDGHDDDHNEGLENHRTEVYLAVGEGKQERHAHVHNGQGDERQEEHGRRTVNHAHVPPSLSAVVAQPDQAASCDLRESTVCKHLPAQPICSGARFMRIYSQDLRYRQCHADYHWYNGRKRLTICD